MDEFVRIMNGYNMSDESNGPIETFPHLDDADMPTEVNWVKKVTLHAKKEETVFF